MKKKYLASLLFFLITQSIICSHQGYDTQHYHDLAIVIPTYNAIEWYKKCLDSVREQVYPREKVTVYILDDCSTDGQADAIEQYIKDHNEGDRFHLIKNTQKWWPAGNRWRANHLCDPEQIIIDYDGDDWFAHPHVLARVNEEYNKGNVLVTWGQWQSYPQNKIGTCRPIPQEVLKAGTVRSYHPEGTEPNTLATGHLRTYKAWLYQQIKFKDFLFHGEIYRTCCDVQTMLTLLEMAQERSSFIPEVLYIYNCINPISAWRTKLKTQRAINTHIRSQKPYSRIEQKASLPSFKTSMILFAENPLKTESYLKSVAQCIKDLNNSYILIPAHYRDHASFKRIKEDFPNYTYVEYEKEQFKNVVLKTLEQCNDFVLLSTEHAHFAESFDLASAARALHKVHAHAFYAPTKTLRRFFGYTKCLVPVDEGDIAAWQYRYAKEPCNTALALSGVLYKKSVAVDCIKNNDIKALKDIESALTDGSEPDDLGLVYQAFVKGLVPEPQPVTSSYLKLNWLSTLLLIFFCLGVGILIVRPNMIRLP